MAGGDPVARERRDDGARTSSARRCSTTGRSTLEPHAVGALLGKARALTYLGRTREAIAALDQLLAGALVRRRRALLAGAQ